MREIKLSCGAKVIVDDEDYDWLSRWKWKKHRNGYAVRNTTENGKRMTIYMHREIARATPGQEVDHKHGRKYDNRRSQLKVVTPTEHRKKHAHVLVDYVKRKRSIKRTQQGDLF
jgi:hypothetical protein